MAFESSFVVCSTGQGSSFWFSADRFPEIKLCDWRIAWRIATPDEADIMGRLTEQRAKAGDVDILCALLRGAAPGGGTWFF